MGRVGWKNLGRKSYFRTKSWERLSGRTILSLGILWLWRAGSSGQKVLASSSIMVGDFLGRKLLSITIAMAFGERGGLAEVL
jgi:hypothetical protein